MIFHLGADQPSWLTRAEHDPLFYSWRAIQNHRRKAVRSWALDSGGFTQIIRSGRYETTPEEYARGVRRLANEVGGLVFAVVQDWPCQDMALAMTGLTVQEHMNRTVRSTVRLLELDATLPWTPVLTGITADDYLRCADMHFAAGVDLTAFERVCVGALVGRPHVSQVSIIQACGRLGLRLHGLGIKGRALEHVAPLLASADSISWSLYARRAGRRLCETGTHERCNHCLDWAQRWAARVMEQCGQHSQTFLDV